MKEILTYKNKKGEECNHIFKDGFYIGFAVNSDKPESDPSPMVEGWIKKKKPIKELEVYLLEAGFKRRKLSSE